MKAIFYFLEEFEEKCFGFVPDYILAKCLLMIIFDLLIAILMAADSHLYINNMPENHNIKMMKNGQCFILISLVILNEIGVHECT